MSTLHARGTDIQSVLTGTDLLVITRLADVHVLSRRIRSAPPPVQPQPLLGVLAYTALHDRGDRLRGGVDVDVARAVALRLDRLGELDAETMIGKADGACPVDRAVEAPGESRDHRVGLARAAEELDVDALIEELVDQDSHVRPALER